MQAVMKNTGSFTIARQNTATDNSYCPSRDSLVRHKHPHGVDTGLVTIPPSLSPSPFPVSAGAGARGSLSLLLSQPFLSFFFLSFFSTSYFLSSILFVDFSRLPEPTVNFTHVVTLPRSTQPVILPGSINSAIRRAPVVKGENHLCRVAGNTV